MVDFDLFFGSLAIPHHHYPTMLKAMGTPRKFEPEILAPSISIAPLAAQVGAHLLSDFADTSVYTNYQDRLNAAITAAKNIH